MRLLSIDPALKGPTGWAWFEYDKLLSFGTILGKHIWDWGNRKSKLGSADALVIEEQGTWGYKTAQKPLIISVCLWRIPAHDHFKIPVHEINPNDWLGACQRGYRRGIKKDIAVLKHYVKQRYKVDVISNDAISAICIGTYYLDNHGRLFNNLRGK